MRKEMNRMLGLKRADIFRVLFPNLICNQSIYYSIKIIKRQAVKWLNKLNDHFFVFFSIRFDQSDWDCVGINLILKTKQNAVLIGELHHRQKRR